MTVKGIFNIKGRGHVIAVTGAAKYGIGLKTGVLVHQGDKAWRIRGVERFLHGKLQDDVGLLLHGEDVERYGLPEVGKELKL